MVTSLPSRNNTSTTGHYFSNLNFFFLSFDLKNSEKGKHFPFFTPKRKVKLVRINRPARLPTWLGPHYLIPNMYQPARFPTQTCSSSLPHFNTQHLHYFSCSGPKPWCYLPFTPLFLSLHIIHPSMNQTMLAPPEMSPKSSHFSSPLLLHHHISPRSLLDLLPVSTFAPTPHSILYTSALCLLKICQIKSLWTKPAGGFPYHSRVVHCCIFWDENSICHLEGVHWTLLISKWRENGQSHRTRATQIFQCTSVRRRPDL